MCTQLAIVNKLITMQVYGKGLNGRRHITASSSSSWLYADSPMLFLSALFLAGLPGESPYHHYEMFVCVSLSCDVCASSLTKTQHETMTMAHRIHSKKYLLFFWASHPLTCCPLPSSAQRSVCVSCDVFLEQEMSCYIGVTRGN